MNTVPDYIADLGGTIRYEHGRCRILYRHHNAVFPQIAPEELRSGFNEAMHNAVLHYTNNVDEAAVQMNPRQIQDAAFGVVLHTLYVYNMWRHTYESHRNQPLVVGPDELAHPQSHDQCWFYSKKEFGDDYRGYVAALIGISLEQLSKYEEGQRRFFDR